MKDIEHWKREGFAFEARFPNEYDLWMNRDTMQKLRRYTDGREWLSNPKTGEYELVQETPNAEHEPQRGTSRSAPCSCSHMTGVQRHTADICDKCGHSHAPNMLCWD